MSQLCQRAYTLKVTGCFIDGTTNPNLTFVFAFGPWLSKTGGLVAFEDNVANTAWYYLNHLFQQNPVGLPGQTIPTANFVSAAGRYLAGQTTVAAAGRNFWLDLQTNTIRDLGDGSASAPNHINDNGDLALYSGTSSFIYTAATNSFSANLLTANNYQLAAINNNRDSTGIITTHANFRSAAGAYTDIHPGGTASTPGVNNDIRKVINSAGHVAGSSLVGGFPAPFAYLGGAAFFLSGPILMGKIMINDLDYVAWDDTGNNHVLLRTTGIFGNVIANGRLAGMNNAGVIVGINAGNPAWVYSAGVVSNVIDKIPTAAAQGWTSLGTVYDISDDNFVTGVGVKNGVSTLFVAKLCL